MQLPASLRTALESEAARFHVADLAQVSERLSQRYRAQTVAQPLSEVERVAYALTRLPATYAVCATVLGELAERLEWSDATVELTSLLDLGAGLGSMLWAAAEVCPRLAHATLVDRDREMLELGQTLAESAAQPVITTATWKQTNVEGARLENSDLVTCSYSLGEMSASGAAHALEAAWQAARKLLVIIEPGTPAGFARIREWRRTLLAMEAHMVAPCPHANACPMHENDWCHFAQRVERTSLHRRLKGGTLGHEDEKFSYVAVSKVPIAPVEARIIRHPQSAPGAIRLNVCAADGLHEIVATRKNREQFRHARHARWGGAWQATPQL